MRQRFAVRRSDNGDGYAVWDAGVSGWRSRLDLTEPDAVALADQMQAQWALAQDPPQPPAGTRDGLRRVDPARAVLVRTPQGWFPGWLDWWSREPDGWHGRALITTGAGEAVISWYPATSLRPAD